MISRVEEIERRLEWLQNQLNATQAALAAAHDRINQLAGLGGLLSGGSSAVTFGRAAGAITARSGTTLGSGTFNFSDAPAGTLTEGSEDSPCKNILDLTIADNAWLLLVKEPDWWVVVAADDCANLS